MGSAGRPVLQERKPRLKVLFRPLLWATDAGILMLLAVQFALTRGRCGAPVCRCPAATCLELGMGPGSHPVWPLSLARGLQHLSLERGTLVVLSFHTAGVTARGAAWTVLRACGFRLISGCLVVTEQTLLRRGGICFVLSYYYFLKPNSSVFSVWVTPDVPEHCCHLGHQPEWPHSPAPLGNC